MNGPFILKYFSFSISISKLKMLKKNVSTAAAILQEAWFISNKPLIMISCLELLDISGIGGSVDQENGYEKHGREHGQAHERAELDVVSERSGQLEQRRDHKSEQQKRMVDVERLHESSAQTTLNLCLHFFFVHEKEDFTQQNFIEMFRYSNKFGGF